MTTAAPKQDDRLIWYCPKCGATGVLLSACYTVDGPDDDSQVEAMNGAMYDGHKAQSPECDVWTPDLVVTAPNRIARKSGVC